MIPMTSMDYEIFQFKNFDAQTRVMHRRANEAAQGHALEANGAVWY